MIENRLNRSLTIMLIDDNDVDLFINAKIISNYFPDFNIIELRNANDALNYLKKSARDNKHFNIIPDFILLDLAMPCKDGFDFLKEYKYIQFPGKRSPELIVLSCSIDPQDHERCKKDLDVSKFVVKPLREKNITQIFSQAV